MLSHTFPVEGSSSVSNMAAAAMAEGKILVNIFPTGILMTNPMIHKLTATNTMLTKERDILSHFPLGQGGEGHRDFGLCDVKIASRTLGLQGHHHG